MGNAEQHKESVVKYRWKVIYGRNMKRHNIDLPRVSSVESAKLGEKE